jgi:AraC-like DNA-binding protein
MRSIAPQPDRRLAAAHLRNNRKGIKQNPGSQISMDDGAFRCINARASREPGIGAVTIVRRTLFEGDAFQIGRFEARPRSDACGDVEWQAANAIVLPISGVFSKHDAPGRYLIGTPSHAVLFTAGVPYRIGFPGAIGDRALVLRFGEALAHDLLEPNASRERRASHGLLRPHAMVLRNLLWTRLQRAEVDALETEVLGLQLLSMAVGSMRAGSLPSRGSTLARRKRAVERVKEAVAVSPAEAWNIAKLAEIANLSPFHLCRVFRHMVGSSISHYVLHERLALTLDVVLDGNADFTAIALDAGFSSHSHFSACFRQFFGCTPTALRRARPAKQVAELRKIMTARGQRPV